MSQNEPLDVLIRQEHAEAIVFRIGVHRLGEDEASVAVRDALYREAEVANRPLILDFSEVEYFSSAALGWLIHMRKKLIQRERPFKRRRPRWELFAIFRDQAEALEALRHGKPDSLVLCGISPAVKEVFEIC